MALGLERAFIEALKIWQFIAASSVSRAPLFPRSARHKRAPSILPANVSSLGFFFELRYLAHRGGGSLRLASISEIFR